MTAHRLRIVSLHATAPQVIGIMERDDQSSERDETNKSEVPEDANTETI